MKRIFYMLVMTIGLLGSCIIPASAEEGAKVLLKLEQNQSPVSNAPICMTYLGCETDSGYSWDPAFAPYYLDSEERYTSDLLLYGYQMRDGIPATVSDTTKANGMAAFSGLATGDYLIGGTTTVLSDGSLLQIEPTVLSVKGGEAVQDVELKYLLVDQLNVTEFKVRKDWTFDEGETIPESIQVSLFCDGASQETVTLDHDGDWSHTWSGLTPGHFYTVLEDSVPDGFLVSAVHYGQDAVIKNRSIQSEDPAESSSAAIESSDVTEPSESSNETEASSDVTEPSESSDETEASEPSESQVMVPESTGPMLETTAAADSTLPSTGMVTWPLFALVGISGLCLAIGVIMRKRR